MSITENLTPAEAMTATEKANSILKSLIGMYEAEIEAGLYPEPTLTPGGYGSDFAISWEDGPYEWAMRLDGQPDRELMILCVESGLDAEAARRHASTAPLAVPADVEVEPIFSFALSIDIY